MVVFYVTPLKETEMTKVYKQHTDMQDQGGGNNAYGKEMMPQMTEDHTSPDFIGEGVSCENNDYKKFIEGTGQYDYFDGDRKLRNEGSVHLGVLGISHYYN